MRGEGVGYSEVGTLGSFFSAIGDENLTPVVARLCYIGDGANLRAVVRSNPYTSTWTGIADAIFLLVRFTFPVNSGLQQHFQLGS